MMDFKSVPAIIYLVISISLIASCGGESSNDGVGNYTIGGTVTGLASDNLVLQNNGSDDLEVAGNSFIFNTALSTNDSYAVTVLSQPRVQHCKISNSVGTVSSTNVDNMAVNCVSPELIQDNAVGQIFYSKLVIDEGGSVVATTQTNTGIYARRHTEQDGWGESIQLTTSGLTSEHQIAMDAGGNVLVVWVEQDSTPQSQFTLWSNRYIAGSGWGIAEKIPHPYYFTNIFGITNKMAMNEDGKAVVIWTYSSRVYANIYTPGSGWGATQNIDSGYDVNKSLDVAINGGGQAVATWTYGAASVITKYYDPNQGWDIQAVNMTENQPVGGIQHLVDPSPKVAIDDLGNATVAWAQRSSNTSTAAYLYAARYIANSGWGSIESLKNTFLVNTKPRIDVITTGNGNVLVIYWSNNSTDSLVSFQYTLENGWIEENEPFSFYKFGALGVTNDGNGMPLIYWFDGNDLSNEVSILASTYISGTGWGISRPIASNVRHRFTNYPDTGGYFFGYQMAINKNGNAMATWLESPSLSSVEYDVWAGSFELD